MERGLFFFGWRANSGIDTRSHRYTKSESFPFPFPFLFSVVFVVFFFFFFWELKSRIGKQIHASNSKSALLFFLSVHLLFSAFSTKAQLFFPNDQLSAGHSRRPVLFWSLKVKVGNFSLSFACPFCPKKKIQDVYFGRLSKMSQVDFLLKFVSSIDLTSLRQG